MEKVVEIRPTLAKLNPWLDREMEQLYRMKYEELMLMPDELEIDGPYIHPDVKYFVRRQFNARGAPGVPPGTVEVFLCVDIFENGQLAFGSWPSVEMTPRGRILNLPRPADPRD